MLCKAYCADRIYIVGRQSAWLSCIATYGFISQQIEVMTAAHWAQVPEWQQENTTHRKWVNSFRAGAASTVAARLQRNMAQLEAGNDRTAMVLRGSALANRDFLKSEGTKLRSGSQSYRPEINGFESGRAAGHGINIGARAGSDKQLT